MGGSLYNDSVNVNNDRGGEDMIVRDKVLIIISCAGICFMLLRCSPTSLQIEDRQKKWDKEHTKIVEIDNCEYIVKKHQSSSGWSETVVHKGNCKFCKERNKIQQ